MGQLGADVEQLDRLAGTMEQEGSHLRGASTSITWMFLSAWWVGPDADKSRNWWALTGRGQVTKAAGWLDQLGKALRRQAEQQRAASQAGGGGGGFWGWVKETAGGAWDAVQGAWNGVTEWASDAWQTTTAFLHSGAAKIDELGNQGLPTWVPGPVRDVVNPVLDRGGTWIHYSWDTGWRRISDPLQTIKDIRTGTVLAEDIAAAQGILGEDAEIYEPADPRLRGATYLVGASAPSGADAITIGHTVRIADPGTPSPDLVAHEYQHVKDIEDVGALTFYGSYLGNYAVNRVTGMDHDTAYRNIVWEQRAYEISQDWSDSDPNNNDIPEGILDGWGKFLPPLPGPFGLSWS